MVLAMIRKSEPCVCDKCGDEHMTGDGLLANLPPEAIIKLLDSSPADAQQEAGIAEQGKKE